ncbi:glycosyltransferase [Actinomycetospora lutea]|uniref:glycosyltransferase n=1 Tax=Actinomycetospora lutea TaxID=663604 RepID=UPI0023657D01|nr:glycosyltransferase [Actinomycetospora lutea]MDD7941984.1 glycosyltransferase [Actinomycetospora lutea]
MSLRVAIVHDYLTQRGGAERVALAMLRCFPDATLYTTVYNPETTFPEFAEYDIRTTRLSDFPVFRADPRRALPFLAKATSGIVIDDVDVVLASTSGWAHGVMTSAPIVAYCHTPARWLYEGSDYFKDKPSWFRRLFELASPMLRRWDKAAAARVSTYVANSSLVARRIERVYGITPQVVFPPTTLTTDGPMEPIVGLEPGFLLTVGRKRGYKNLDRICEAVDQHTDRRLVVVGELPDSPSAAGWSDRLQEINGASDAQLRWLYAHCAGVVAMSHEDFGLTPVEGFNFGAPAVALAAGGFLDSCTDDAVAVLVPDLSTEAIAAGVEDVCARVWDREVIKLHSKGFGLASFAAQIDEILGGTKAAPSGGVLVV